MSSKTKKMRQQEEVVKQQIMDGKRRGVCDGEGETVIQNGRPAAKPRFPAVSSAVKNYVFRGGKMVEI
jgi:hypothetical protein